MSGTHRDPPTNALALVVQLLAGMAVIYTIEPLLGQIYTTRAIRAMENVLSRVRKEVFRVLLMQPISFFDKHSPGDLSNILAVELDALRSFAFGCVAFLRSHFWQPWLVEQFNAFTAPFPCLLVHQYRWQGLLVPPDWSMGWWQHPHSNIYKRDISLFHL